MPLSRDYGLNQTPIPGFNPGFTPAFLIYKGGVNPGLNPGFGVLRCGLCLWSLYLVIRREGHHASVI
jgi:hypothetical protein